jgi:HSP20 family molecular chaperone IbpA
MRNISITLLLAGSLSLSQAGHSQTTPILSSTLDVSEDPGAYTVRLGVGEKNDIKMRLAGTTLVLDTSAGASRHEQQISLPAALPDSALGIKRDRDQLVITVQKGNAAFQPPAAPSPMQSGASGNDPFDSLRDQMLSQAAAMIGQVNQMVKNQSPGSQDLLGTLLNQSGLLGALGTGSQSGFEIVEEPDKYILRAEIPEAQAKNINVKVDNDRFITITSRQDQNSSAAGMTAYSASSSSQSLTLPGPVRGDAIEMDYKEGRLEVKLPKR